MNKNSMLIVRIVAGVLIFTLVAGLIAMAFMV